MNGARQISTHVSRSAETFTVERPRFEFYRVPGCSGICSTLDYKPPFAVTKCEHYKILDFAGKGRECCTKHQQREVKK